MGKYIKILMATLAIMFSVSACSQENGKINLQLISTIYEPDGVVLKLTDKTWPKMCTSGYLMIVDTSSTQGEVGCWYRITDDQIQISRFQDDGVWYNYYLPFMDP